MRIYLDANFFISYVENDTPELKRVVEKAIAGRWQLVTSEFTLTEVLVVPLRNADSRLVGIYEDLLAERDVFDVTPVSLSILRSAAQVRAEIGNKTPDAIHIATATERSCRTFLSSDQRIKLPPSLEAVPLDRTADLEKIP